MEFRVLTAKEQNTITKSLEKANSLLASLHALITEAAPVKKVRKVRKAKVAPAAAPVAADPPKKRGRPAKVVPTEVTI